MNLKAILKQTESKYISLALKKSNNNIAQAAKLLGMKRTTLYMRMVMLKMVDEPKKKTVSREPLEYKCLASHKNSVEDELWGNK